MRAAATTKTRWRDETMAAKKDFPGTLYRDTKTGIYQYKAWIKGRGQWKRSTGTRNHQKAVAVARNLYQRAALLSDTRNDSLDFDTTSAREVLRLEREVSKGQAERAAWAFQAFATWAPSGLTLDRIDRAMLERYAKHRAKGAKGRSRSTIRKELQFLRRLLRQNALDVDLPEMPQAAGERPGRPFSRDELKAFFEASAEHPEYQPGRYTPLWLLLLATGARPAEIVPSRRSGHVALLKREVDVEAGAVLIRGAKRRARARVKQTRVPVAPEILELCMAQAPTGSPHVFEEIDVGHVFARLARHAGLKQTDELGEGLTAHSFRHTYATALVERGATAPILQAALRHADLRMAARYTERAAPAMDVVDLAEFVPGVGPKEVADEG